MFYFDYLLTQASPENVEVDEVEVDEVFKCGECGTTYPSEDALMSHLREHLNENVVPEVKRKRSVIIIDVYSVLFQLGSVVTIYLFAGTWF